MHGLQLYTTAQNGTTRFVEKNGPTIRARNPVTRTTGMATSIGALRAAAVNSTLKKTPQKNAPLDVGFLDVIDRSAKLLWRNHAATHQQLTACKQYITCHRQVELHVGATIKVAACPI